MEIIFPKSILHCSYIYILLHFRNCSGSLCNPLPSLSNISNSILWNQGQKAAGINESLRIKQQRGNRSVWGADHTDSRYFSDREVSPSRSLTEALQTAFPRFCRSPSFISKAFWHVSLDEFRSMKDLLIPPPVQSLLLTWGSVCPFTCGKINARGPYC